MNINSSVCTYSGVMQFFPCKKERMCAPNQDRTWRFLIPARTRPDGHAVAICDFAKGTSEIHTPTCFAALFLPWRHLEKIVEHSNWHERNAGITKTVGTTVHGTPISVAVKPGTNRASWACSSCPVTLPSRRRWQRLFGVSSRILSLVSPQPDTPDLPKAIAVPIRTGP